MLKIKRFTALILIAVLAVSVAALGALYVTAQAEENVTKITDGFVYDETDAKKVVGVNVPSSVTGMIELVFPAGTTSVGEGSGDTAFSKIVDSQNRSRIAAVSLPDSLETIDNAAFAGTAISSVNIPVKVKTVGQHAFAGCTALTSVTFAARTADQSLQLGAFSFANCAALKTIALPDKTTVLQLAFDGCTSLLWVYAGDHCVFENKGGDLLPDATFFPTNTQLSIVFPSKSTYDEAMNRDDTTFKNKHGSAATYVVKVNRYVGSSSQPIVDERLHGHDYNYVKDAMGAWSEDTAYSALPVQDVSYASTTWYSDAALSADKTVTYANVNALLKDSSTTVINLYCHETIPAPKFPEEPASWVYSDDVSYDIANKKEVLTALNCIDEFTDAQLAAMDFNVVFANEKGDVTETPAAINANGVYNVTIALNSAYGVWAQTVNPSVTVNVNTAGFNIVLIVFLILGTIGLIATASTAIIRKKIQDRHKRKQLTQKEVLEKYKAIGGESDLLK